MSARCCSVIAPSPATARTARSRIASTDSSSWETHAAVGCTDYVTKPINATELLAKVRNFLGEVVEVIQ